MFALTTTTDTKKVIPQLDSSVFTWERWRAGSIHDLGVPCRKEWILSPYGIGILRDLIVGYCDGERLGCRPKIGEVAVMVEKNGETFWFHLRKEEFEGINE